MTKLLVTGSNAFMNILPTFSSSYWSLEFP